MTQAEPRTICLVDGSGYIFRAFYALLPMTRPDGTPVNAVYGFMNMMMNLTQGNGCSHIVVVFDAKRRNFRNEIYPDYKKNRRETPPELAPQFPLVRQAAEALNIPWIEQEGFEADDLIATYVRLANEKGWKARVISADKDLMQLMPLASLYDPMKKKELTPQDVMGKFGVPPEKVVDVQALMGDASDNVPGAAGIGPKTAAELINSFGSLDSLMAQLDKIPQEKRRQGLMRDADQIRLSQRLVQLDAHVPVTANLEDFKVRAPHIAAVEAFLEQNNFQSLLKRTNAWTQHRTLEIRQREEPAYQLIQDEEALRGWLDGLRGKTHVAIDTETTGLDPLTARLVGFSLSAEPGRACYVPLRHGAAEAEKADLFSFKSGALPNQIPVEKAMALLRPILENPALLKIGHNIKYDLHILTRASSSPIRIAPIADTLLMSALLEGSLHGHGLDELALLFFNHTTIKYEDVCGSGRKKIGFSEVPLDKACAYAAEDADITLRLYRLLAPRLKQEGLQTVYDAIDAPLIPVLMEMEQKGILVDRAHLKRLDTLFSRKLQDLTEDVYRLAGETFNINSPAQLGVILFEKLGYAGGKKGANQAWTTDVKVLTNLADEGSELAQAVLDYRTFAKLKSTYVDDLLERSAGDPRIHTSFSLAATNTGRLASSDPNLQNIPIRTEYGKEIRRAFIARKGYSLLCADYSQIELRLMADIARVKALQASFHNNEDIHARTASQIFGIPLAQIDPDTRRRAKAINFGIIYGISAFGLARQLGISRTEAQTYIDSYFAQYPEIKAYMKKTEEDARRDGYVLTPLGRKCFIMGAQEAKTRDYAGRAAANAPIQGGAADIIKLAMSALRGRIQQSGLDASLLLQVHDELVFEVAQKDVPALTPLVKETMENIVSLCVPLIVDIGIGDNWKEAH